MANTLFQYCQKIVLFRNNDTEVLLGRRVGEADYDATYSFIGGKLETEDGGLLAGLKREKNEEIGTGLKIKVAPYISWNVYFVKSDGTHMILPHHYAVYQSGDIKLNDEYDDYKWVKVSDIAAFSPKIANIPEAIKQVLQFKAHLSEDDFVSI